MNTTPDALKVYDHSRLAFLREVGRDLTRDAQTGKIKPVVGREKEIQLLIETLCRETKSNPVLIGAAGVGKTALVEGLAIRIYRERVPEKLQGCRLFSVSASALIAGCNWYGMIETRVKHLLAEARHDKVIVFVDEIHTIVGTSPDFDSTRDIAQQLKPALARGEIKLIGATTDEEYRRFIETDAALERRFQPIQVAELSIEQTFTLLKKLAKQFAEKNKLEIPESVLRLVLSYGERFQRNRHFPDKAIDLLEQAAASAEASGKVSVSAEEAAEVVRRMIGIPADLSDSLDNLEESVCNKKLLDAEVSKQFCDLLRVSMQGASVSPKRAHAVVFLAGRTAEKTQRLAEIISEEIYADKTRIVRINFAEINDRWEFNQMIGIGGGRRVSPESAVAKIANTPWCVVVCENLESCHQSVREIWARTLENGFLVDADNRKVYLSDAIILLSADVPASLMNKPGFNSTENETENTNERLERLFSKSLLKFADFIVFENKADQPDERRRWLKENLHDNLGKRFMRQGFYLRWDESVVEYLQQKLEESDNRQDWERFVNVRLLPELLPFLAAQNGRRLSVSVKCEQGKIKVDAEELPADRQKSGESDFQENRRQDFYVKTAVYLGKHYTVETKEDFSTLLISDGAIQTEIYFSIWKEHLLLSFLLPIAERIDAENLAYLLEKNMILRFGKFAIDGEGAVFFEYSMIGEYCTTQSIFIVFKNLLETARKYKQELRALETDVLTSQWLSDEAAEWLESRRVVKSKK